MTRLARVGMMVLGLVVVALVGSSMVAHFPAGDALRPAAPGGSVIRVQVLNGSREGGVGSRVAFTLREGGFHVVEVGNADRSDYFATLVVARTADPKPAEAVARYLGGLPVVRQEWASDVAEVTVVLGSDRSHLRLD